MEELAFREVFAETDVPLCGLPRIVPLPEFTSDLDVVSRTVRLSFPSTFGRASTVFGGKTDEPIILNAFEVARLPHDLVLSCFDVLGGPMDIGGLTPDIVSVLEDGAPTAVEIGTTRAPVIAALRELILNKTAKYKDLIETGQLSALNVVAVNSRAAHSAEGPLPEADQWALVRAYRRGIAVVAQFEREFGSNDLLELGEDADKLDTLLSFGWDSEMPGPALSIDTHFRIGLKSYLTDVQDWNSMWRTWSNGEKMDGVSVHLPFVCPERSDAEMLDFPEFDGPYGTLFAGAIGMSFGQSRDFDTLRLDSMLRAGQVSGIEKNDTRRIRFSIEERLELAMRGVMAKELGKGEFGQMMRERDRSSKEPISITCDTSSLDTWVNLVPEIMPGSCLSLGEIQELTDSSGNLMELMRLMTSTRDLHCIYFLELVAREVMYNMDRNPDDSGMSKEIIYRKIPGYAALMAIRTTRMGGGDDAPCFFSLLFKGSPGGLPFERSVQIDDDWCYTRFVSLSRRKAENLANITAQSASLWGLTLDNAQMLHPDSGMSELMMTRRPWAEAMLVLLEDKDHTSRNLQQLRYYYMELLSGMPNCKTSSLKVLDRFDEILRSRILVRVMQKLRAIHESLPEDFHKRRQDKGDLKEVVEEEEQASASTGSEKVADAADLVLREPLATPFGFDIRDPGDVLQASYMCMLHNKNEQNYGHGAIQIVEKMMAQQLAQRQKASALGHPIPHIISGPNVDPDSLERFQHSPAAVNLGAQLTIKSICEHNGWGVEDYPRLSKMRMLSRMLRTTLDELATTKSSTVPFDPDLIVTADGKEVKTLGARIKCIEAAISWMEESVDHRPALELRRIYVTIKDLEGGGFQVTLFRKNQIGGVREILVLTFAGRMLLRVHSDMHRELCHLHPSEVLTDDSSKDRFVREHFTRVRASAKEGEIYLTMAVSGDMEKWAPGFTMYDQNSASNALLPQAWTGFSRRVYELHRNKMVQLPRTAVEMFYSSPDSELSDKGADWAKELFLGLDEDPVMKRGVPIMHLKTDMLQGILHYQSSIYHVCHLEYLKSMIESWVARESRGEVRVIFSFVVSSDDEGILITLLGPPANTKLIARRLSKMWPRIKRSADALFGLTTSSKKTTVTWADWFEFNSKFYLGNSVVSPLIKFVARSCDDNPQESLSRRVAALYSQLRQLREAGGTGFLCHWVSICQAITFNMNLGVDTMTWYEPGCLKRISRGLTTLGAYLVLPPMIAGLADSSYVNWVASKESEENRKLLFQLSAYALPEDMEDLETAMFGVFPVRRWRNFLERVGLQGVQRSDLVTSENFQEYLKPTQSISQAQRQIRRKALDPTLASSFSWPNRVMSLRMTPYILWSAMFRTDDYRVDLTSLVERLLAKPLTVSREVLFPQWRQYIMVDHLLQIPVSYIPLSRKRRLHYQWVAPFFLAGDHQSSIKAVLLEKWYGRRATDMTVGRVEMHWQNIKTDLPFLSEDGPDLSLEQSPFSALDQLLSFIEGYSQINRPVKLLARGSLDAAGNSLEKLIRFNLSATRHYRFMTEVELTPAEALLFETLDVSRAPVIDPRLTTVFSSLEDRLKAWYELLRRPDAGSDESPLLREMVKDIHDQLIDSLRVRGISLESAKISSTGSKRLDEMRWQILLMTGHAEMTEAWAKLESATIWMEPEELVSGVYKGDYSLIRKRGDLTIRMVKEGRHLSGFANRTEKIVSQTLKRVAFDTLSYENVGIPHGICVDVTVVKGSRMMVFQGADSEFYMSLPNAQMRINEKTRQTLSNNQPSFVERWLRRENLDKDEMGQMVNAASGQGLWAEVARSMIRAARDLSVGRVSIQIQERTARMPEVLPVEALMTEMEILAFAEAIRPLNDWADDEVPAEEIDDPEDIFNVYSRVVGEQVVGVQSLGIEAFAVEEGYSALEINRTIRSVLTALYVMSESIAISFFNPELQKAVGIFKGTVA